jgi:DNA-binding response OmpR family regulator
MDVDRWSVVIVSSSDEAAREFVTHFCKVGAHPAVLTDSEAALKHSACEQANIFVVAADAEPIDGLEWVRRLRRQRKLGYKTPVVLIAPSLSPALVEASRTAGANAIIGLPLTGRTLIKTVKRVFAQNRPFTEGADYIGPCKRTGIITAWPSSPGEVNGR